ncbi:hypothetical protein Dsin_011470 [Dipteronia sinensis]|uniref:Uncharacterized protein n=1 Tax=Dipteronia sinensis TaxID=43782 RepID=A0AAE0AVD0_9ROSI|nr:hypothetical protein Dsin_011470 [Dipteronia sinensis]
MTLRYQRLGIVRLTGRNETFILECSRRMEDVRIKLGFKGKLVVNSVGCSEGLCLLWSDDVLVDLLSYSQYLIDAKIQSHSSKVWQLKGLYGNPEADQCQHSWTLLRRLQGVF